MVSIEKKTDVTNVPSSPATSYLLLIICYKINDIYGGNDFFTTFMECVWGGIADKVSSFFLRDRSKKTAEHMKLLIG